MDAYGAKPDAPLIHVDAGRVLDVVRSDLFVADRGEMGRITRVVSADHDHEVERLGDQLEHGILPLLSRRADRIERAEVVGSGGIPPPPRHALPYFARDREGFTGEHR